MGLAVAGPGQGVLAGARWGGRQCPGIGGQAWGWNDQWSRLEGVRE